jgi:hypothetical protein
MKYLVLLTPAEGHAYDEFKPLLLEEQKAIWAAYRQGRLREWYIQFEPFTVTFIFEAESPESVSAELDRLPIVRGFGETASQEPLPWPPGCTGRHGTAIVGAQTQASGLGS